jgi:hypothetical protein
MPSEWCIGLKNNVEVPLTLEAIEELMFAKIG